MKLTRGMLDDAAGAGVLEPEQADKLWRYLAAHQSNEATFTPANIFYYFGGVLAIGAMTLFMTLGWERFGGWGLFGLALCYAAAGILLLRHWLYRRNLHIPAGLAGAFVVALTPLAVYGLQSGLGFWPGGLEYRDYYRDVDWRWLFMALATLAVGAILLWRYALPFMVAPVAITLWLLSMLLAPLLLPALQEPEAYRFAQLWEFRRLVSMIFGLAMLGLAFWVDMRSRRGRDFGFWFYLFGLLAFWCAFTLWGFDDERSWLGLAAVNLALILVGAILVRRVFVLFGAVGVAYYVGHLAFEVFRDSMLFPFALTLLGFAIIWLGIIWQRHEAAIGERLRGLLPAPLRELLARRRE